MIEILEKIYSVIIPILPFCFGIAFIGFILLFVSDLLDKLKKNSKKVRVIAIILLAQIFILGLTIVVLQEIIITKIRNEFIEIVENPETKIVQKDYTFGNFTSEELKNELLKTKDYDAHHSGTAKKMKLELITKGNKYIVTIAQDDCEKEEFWIFFDKYWFGSGDEEIGRIKTSKFE